MCLDTESPLTLPSPPELGERVTPGAVSPYHFEKISQWIFPLWERLSSRDDRGWKPLPQKTKLLAC